MPLLRLLLITALFVAIDITASSKRPQKPSKNKLFFYSGKKLGKVKDKFIKLIDSSEPANAVFLYGSILSKHWMKSKLEALPPKVLADAFESLTSKTTVPSTLAVTHKVLHKLVPDEVKLYILAKSEKFGEYIQVANWYTIDVLREYLRLPYGGEKGLYQNFWLHLDAATIFKLLHEFNETNSVYWLLKALIVTERNIEATLSFLRNNCFRALFLESCFFTVVTRTAKRIQSEAPGRACSMEILSSFEKAMKRIFNERILVPFEVCVKSGDLECVEQHYLGTSTPIVIDALLFGRRRVFKFLFQRASLETLEGAAMLGRATKRGEKCKRAVVAWKAMREVRYAFTINYTEFVKIAGGVNLFGHTFEPNPDLTEQAILANVCYGSIVAVHFLLERMSPDMRVRLCEMMKTEQMHNHYAPTSVTELVRRAAAGEKPRDITGFSFERLTLEEHRQDTNMPAVSSDPLLNELAMEVRDFAVDFHFVVPQLGDWLTRLIRDTPFAVLLDFLMDPLRLESRERAVSHLWTRCRPFFEFELFRYMQRSAYNIDELIAKIYHTAGDENAAEFVAGKLATPFVKQCQVGNMEYVRQYYRDPRISCKSYVRAMEVATKEIVEFLLEKALIRTIIQCRLLLGNVSPVHSVAEAIYAVHLSLREALGFPREGASDPRKAESALEKIIKIVGGEFDGVSYPMHPALTDGILVSTIAITLPGKVMTWFIQHVDGEILRDAALYIASTNPRDPRIHALHSAADELYSREIYSVLGIRLSRDLVPIVVGYSKMGR